MSINIQTSGRTDITDYFKLSGIREYRSLPHTPFLVFVVEDSSVKVKLIDKPKDLLTFSDETKVMGQWAGKYRSDFFQFTIGDLKKYIEKNPPQEHHRI